LEDITFSLVTGSTTEGFDIVVLVNKGAVTLKGDVHAWYQRSHARDIASRVRGVSKVINKIGVNDSKERSDSEIADQVRSKLRWN